MSAVGWEVERAGSGGEQCGEERGAATMPTQVGPAGAGAMTNPVLCQGTRKEIGGEGEDTAAAEGKEGEECIGEAPTTAHCNGNGEHSKGAESDGSAEDEDMKNVSVPVLIDKFENLGEDQQENSESDDEKCAKYSMMEEEAQEIPYTVGSVELLTVDNGVGEADQSEEKVTEEIHDVLNSENAEEDTNEGYDEKPKENDSLSQSLSASVEVLTVENGVGEADQSKKEVTEEIHNVVNSAKAEEDTNVSEIKEEYDEEPKVNASLSQSLSLYASELGDQCDNKNQEKDQIVHEEPTIVEHDNKDQKESNVIEETELGDATGETVENGLISSSPRDTLLRQNTYTVSSSTVSQSVLARQDTYILQTEEEMDDREEDKKDQQEENYVIEEEVESLPGEMVYDNIKKMSSNMMEYSNEPIYREAFGGEEDEEEANSIENGAFVVEKQYVTAEEVRIQKHSMEKKITSSTLTTTTMTAQEASTRSEEVVTRNIDNFSEESVMVASMAAVSVATMVSQKQEQENQDKESEVQEPVQKLVEEPVHELEQVEELEVALLTKSPGVNEETRLSQDVDQLVEDIRDPELDSSLEDIAAMVEVK